MPLHIGNAIMSLYQRDMRENVAIHIKPAMAVQAEIDLSVGLNA